MKIYLATASLEQIRWGVSTGLIDGVVTSPTALADEAGDADPRELLAEICAAGVFPVFASVESVSEEDIYRDGRDLARLSDQLVVQIPLVEDAVGAMRRLRSEGVRVSASLVFNAAQALLAAKAGAAHVATAIDELSALGEVALDQVRMIRSVFDADAVECDLLAMLPRDAAQFTECAMAGADAVCLSQGVLRSLLVHPLTDRGLDKFLQALSRLPKSRVPA
jgi:transaldolase